MVVAAMIYINHELIKFSLDNERLNISYWLGDSKHQTWDNKTPECILFCEKWVKSKKNTKPNFTIKR